ncbi:branched-chain amino acid ABC transporter permease [Oscillospiraceae bacterium OttesenSCG-928-G22]|nr:branched-chain amino acid ABC transporter permease [Oscillospiraceae bacterium OttesenSCG-928-G22]
MLIQQLINGLSIGSIYALMAVGYSLIYSLLSFTNFAHSITVAVGAYTAYYVLTLFPGAHVVVAILASVLVGGCLAMFIETVAYRPLLNRNAKRIYLLIAGLGISTVGENLIIVTIGGRFKAYPPTFSIEPVNIFGANVGQVDLVILLVSLIALVLVELLIQKTKIGLAIRGAAFDLNTTSLMGVNVSQLILMVFLIAGSLAGLAGVFLGVKYTAYPAIGAMTTKAFISAVFGGMGSLPGAMAGAMILGVMESLISGYISSSMRDIFSFSLLVIVLLIRPTGLMGKVSEEKA